VSEVYASLLGSFQRVLGITAGWIEPAARDAGSIVVITNQLLDARHQPSADCLDHCRVLQAQLGKKVLLINTADMPWTLELPYYDAIRFNHVEDYTKIGRLTAEGELIDFHQCRKPMPNLDETRAIVRTVVARKPAFVLSLGHSNIAADLCSEFLTVATRPFGTNLSRARSNLFILPRKRRPDDEPFMQEWRISETQIVENAEYTYKLPLRTASLTRADLRLPPDAYAIAIAGNRLDDEITDAVAAELEELLDEVPEVFFAFMGRFPACARLALQHAVLGTRSVFLRRTNAGRSGPSRRMVRDGQGQVGRDRRPRDDAADDRGTGGREDRSPSSRPRHVGRVFSDPPHAGSERTRPTSQFSQRALSIATAGPSLRAGSDRLSR
jgi:hypothetical protein